MVLLGMIDQEGGLPPEKVIADLPHDPAAIFGCLLLVGRLATAPQLIRGRADFPAR